MPKQLNSVEVDVRFKADTTQAKQQIQSLIADLNRIGSTGVKSIGTDKLTSELIKAKIAAQDLGNILNESMNINTGKLDLNKFNSELKKSGMSLTQYGNTLSALGPEGDKAFLKVAQSIAETETPLRRSNGLLKEFGTTLANTTRWQISSSVLHGFIGAVQSAYGYAKDLNRSLNDIRIVTSASTDQMAEFAEKANKAAKALSATTTDYTKASLIYYQQGLSDEEVSARTDVTIKMANASGQSAEIVSDQLTAVWNNFYDGSKSLEYYADVMTALGAATASSADEIAGGLEKFAAIGDTIGLSYEYAASALATITSNTRQSEEVVGTALKTIFARIQGLKLGETLEDGVDLNKYSEALQTVGISIFDTNGELKKMDSILDEMGAKWGTLNKAQQAALAQTVAGVRQYTQLVALMENWNNGDEDSMMSNLDTAYGSSGTLQEQADIYAESWEASEDRVRAAAEGIYQSLIDEDFFIGINNMLEKTLTTIDKMIDAFGGIKGVLGLVGVLVTKIFSNQISQGINNALHNFQVFTGAAEHGMNRLQQEARDYAKSMTEGLVDSPAVQAQRDHLENTFTIQEKLKQSVRGLTEEQIKASEAVADTARRYSKMAMEAGEAVEKVQELTQAQLKSSQDKVGKGAAKRLNDSADIATGLAGGDLIREAKNAINIGEDMGSMSFEVKKVKDALAEYLIILKTAGDNKELVSEKAMKLINSMSELGNAATTTGNAYQQFQMNLNDGANHILDVKDKFEQLQTNIDKVSGDKVAEEITKIMRSANEAGLEITELIGPLKEYKKVMKSGTEDEKAAALDKLKASFRGVKIDVERVDKAVMQHTKSTVSNQKALKGKTSAMLKDAKAARESAQADRNATKLKEEAAKQVANLDKELKKAQQSAKSFGTGFTTGLQAVSSLAMGINSLKGAFDALNDPDMSTFEKFTSVLMSLGMGIPSVLSGLKGLGTAFKDMKAGLGGSFNALMANVMGLSAEALAQDQANDEKKEAIILSGEQGKKTLDDFAHSIKAAAGKALEAEAEEEVNEEKLKGTGLSLGYIAMKKMEQMANAGGTAAKIAETGATIAAKLAQMGLNAALAPFIGLMLAAVAAILPYVAAAGALAAAIWFIVDAYNADAEAAKNAQAQVDSLTTQFDECTTAAEELKKTISNWEDGVTALEHLDHTTDEYKNKLKEVNAEARKLIETYGLYNDYKVEDGIIKFNKGVLEDIQNQADAKVSAVETQLNAAKIISNNANIKSQGTDLGRSMGMMYDAQMSQYSAQSGGGPVYRQASSAEMQGFADAIGGIIDKVSADLPEGEKFELDVATIRKHLEEGVSGLPQIIQDNLSTLSDEDIQAVLDFRNSMIEATEANKYYAEQVMSVSIEDKYGSLYEKAATKNGEVDQGLVESMINAGTQFASENTKVNGKDLKTTLSEIDVSDATSNRSLDKYGYDIKNDKDLALTYAKEVLGWDESDVSYSGGTGKGSITNVKEDKSFDDLDDKFMRQALAQQAKVKEATDAFNAELDSTMKSFNEAMTSTVVNAKDGIGQIIVDAAGSEDKKIDFDQMMTEISPEDIMATNGMNSEQLMKHLGLTAENLEAMGLASGDEFLKGFGQATANYDAQAFYDNMKDKAASSAASQAEEAGFKDEDIEEISDYAKHLMEVADESEELSDDLDENAEAAADLAVQISKMNRGIDTLADNFDDWNDILKKSDKTSAEYSKAMSGMKKALSDVLDVEEDFISSDFVTQNLKDIEKAATGDADAIDRLHSALAEQIVLDIVGVDKFEELPSGLQTALNNMQELIDNTKLDIGESIELNADNIDETGFIDACNEIIRNANMTADQANAYFDALGFEATFATEPQEQTQRVPEYVTETVDEGTHTVTLEDGTKQSFIRTRTRTYQDGYYEATGSVDAIAMTTSTDGSTEVPQIKSITKKAGGSMNNYSSSNPGGKSPGSGGSKGGGGGGGDKAKAEPIDKTKKNDIVERYKEINDSLDDMARKLDKVTKAADRAYGKDRIAKLRQANGLLKEEIGLLEQKRDEANKNLKQDRKDLNSAASAAGVSFTYDKQGNISNYEGQMSSLYARLKAAEAGASPSNFTDKESQDAYIEANVEPLKKLIEELEEAIGQYDETRELLQDLDTEIEDKFYEWQDTNAEILTYSLELKIEINDRELKEIEFYLSRVEDDFYSMAEAAALMVGNLDKNGNLIGGQYAVYTSNLAAYKEQIDALETAYKNGEISQEAYASGLQEIYDGIYDNLSSINELDKAMMNYYGDTIAAAQDEMSKYTDQMEHQTSVLEHYQSLMEIMGKSNDYKKIGTVLKGQSATLRDQLDVAKKTMELYKTQASDKLKLYQTALANGNTEAAELYKKEYEAALVAANEAEDEYLSKAEAYAESLRAILENELAGLAQDLEDALTGGTSFDQMNNALQRANSLQEEYLTTTNKIYETNKLINTAQQEIDKTSNTVAKNRLKQFIAETSSLQDKAKLSKYELEIQQAKYDLLLAEIALEEAQEAKSTVRLQRDSEGNFGYVYTADSSQIAEAEQKLADEQNRLYNISLEGANSYTEKYMQTLNEMYDTLTDLQQQYLEGAFQTEQEYQDAVTAAKEYYYEKLQQYSSLHVIALQTDSRVIEEAWSNEFHNMIYSTETWKSEVEDYVADVSSAFVDWKSELDGLEIEVGLDNIETAVSEITEASEDLTEELTKDGGVIDSLGEELDAVSEITEAWAEQRDTILDLISDYGDLASAVKQVLLEMGKVDDEEQNPPKNPPKNPDNDDDGKKGNAPAVTDSATKRGVALAIWNGNYGWGNNPGRASKLKEKGFDPSEIQNLVNNTDPSAGWGKRYGINDLSKYAYSKFDTGGYTGEWGPYGKMAMLHEKELVLNATDTTNFLLSLELLNKIIDTIDLQAANAQLGGLLNSPSYGGNLMNESVIEQSVHIEASFPGVSERSEIEEAFNNLINQASQYANRK